MNTLLNDNPHDLYGSLVTGLPSDINGPLRAILQSIGVQMVHQGAEDCFMHWARIWKLFIECRENIEQGDSITDSGHMNQLWIQAFSAKSKIAVGPVVFTREHRGDDWYFRASRHPEFWSQYHNLTNLYYLALQNRSAELPA